jgi:hypothetical protein
MPLIAGVLRTTPTARKPLATDKPTDIANVPSSFDTFTVPLCPTHPKRKAILAVVLDLKPKRIVVEYREGSREASGACPVDPRAARQWVLFRVPRCRLLLVWVVARRHCAAV